jgi:hypothetical protein
MEVLLVSGAGRRAVAKQFSVSPDAVWRHGRAHISQEQRAQILGGPVKLQELATKAAAEGVSLLEYIAMLRSSGLHRYFAACEAGDDQAAALLMGRLTDLLRLQGQFSGDLSKAGAQITNNTLILASPLMADLKGMLFERLLPFPEARAAVIQGLRELSLRALAGAAERLPPQQPALEHSPS